MGHNFEKFCKDYENIENYQKALADNFVGWCCHHRKGVDIPREELKASKMYYHRPAEELIFLTESEHDSLHKKGKPKSKEHKNKLSEAKKGKSLSEEHKNKIGEAHKGRKRSEETKKKLSKPKSDETKQKMSEAAKNMSKEHKQKLSETKKGKNNPAYGKHWFNNGTICVISKERPDGFTPGRLRK